LPGSPDTKSSAPGIGITPDWPILPASDTNHDISTAVSASGANCLITSSARRPCTSRSNRSGFIPRLSDHRRHLSSTSAVESTIVPSISRSAALNLISTQASLDLPLLRKVIVAEYPLVHDNGVRKPDNGAEFIAAYPCPPGCCNVGFEQPALTVPSRVPTR